MVWVDTGVVLERVSQFRIGRTPNGPRVLALGGSGDVYALRGERPMHQYRQVRRWLKSREVFVLDATPLRSEATMAEVQELIMFMGENETTNALMTALRYLIEEQSYD